MPHVPGPHVPGPHQRARTKLAAVLDRRFAVLAAAECLAVICASVWIAPYTWAGPIEHLKPHVWIATGLGAVVALLAAIFSLAWPGRAITRHIHAAAQMLMAGLLVHMTGGRIETYFAYFGLLAFLSFYRDWKVLATATAVAALDHVVRAVLWPHSMFGVTTVSLWRPMEHAAWVVFEVALLADFIRRSEKETNRIEAEVRDRTHELLTSEKRYRAIFERSPLPMWLCDNRTLEFLAVNDEAVRKYGFSEAEFLRMRAVDIGPPEDVKEFLRHVRVMRKGLTPARQWRHKKKDGTIFEVETVSHVVEWSGREAFLVLVNDVSDRKRAERERDQMELQWRHAQKLESIGQLASGIAHEINTPTQYVGDNLNFLADSFEQIRSLLALEQRLASQCEHHAELQPLAAEMQGALAAADAPYLMEEIPKALEQAIDGVARITTLVKAMKEFSHPGRKEKAPQNLNHAIENTVTVARNEWKYVADMRLELEAGLPEVPCFLSDFNQVILNLIVNAAHAIRDKAGREGKGVITIRSRRRGEWVEIRVQDTGAGVPPEIQERIFEPFFTTKSVGQGTGQGLAIARSVVVNKHGGTLRLESEAGHGATFIIRLPLTATLGNGENSGIQEASPVEESGRETHSVRG